MHPSQDPCVTQLKANSTSTVTGVTWSVGISACKDKQASGTLAQPLAANGIPETAWEGSCGTFSATLQCVLTKEGWLQTYYFQDNGHVTEGVPVKDTSAVKCSYLSTQTEGSDESVRSKCCFPDAKPGPSKSPTPAPAPRQFVSEIAWKLSVSDCKAGAAEGTINAPVPNDGWPVLVLSVDCGSFTANMYCMVTPDMEVQVLYSQSTGHVAEGDPAKQGEVSRYIAKRVTDARAHTHIAHAIANTRAAADACYVASLRILVCASDGWMLPPLLLLCVLLFCCIVVCQDLLHQQRHLHLRFPRQPLGPAQELRRQVCVAGGGWW